MEIQSSKPEIPTFKYPEIGRKVKCLVLKSSFSQTELKIVEIEGFTTPVNYRGIIKNNSIGEEIYLCDKIKRGEIVDCIVVSYGENSIVVSQL